MPSRRVFAALSALSLSACYPTLKSGADRDAGAVTDRPSADIAVTDVPTVDVPPATQQSCASATERGCGMVRIEGGTFPLGESNEAIALSAAPVQPSISVSAFFMDTHEVTVARFRRFRASGAWGNALTSVPYPAAMVPVNRPQVEPTAHGMTAECNWTASPEALEEHPINCIDWATAMAFCVWDGGRLPTEAEWEWVARGRVVGGLRAGRSYPWGDEPDPMCRRARWNNTAAGCHGEDGARTQRVGRFASTPEGAGGLYDLAGNLLEWSADNFADYAMRGCWGALSMGRANPVCVIPAESAHTLRGGNWFFDSAVSLHSATRLNVGEMPGYDLYGAGLRCVRSP